VKIKYEKNEKYTTENQITHTHTHTHTYIYIYIYIYIYTLKIEPGFTKIGSRNNNNRPETLYRPITTRRKT